MVTRHYLPSKNEILAQLAHINQHVIGRSNNQKKLFEYLVQRELQTIESDVTHQKTPKEIELAIEVFGKNVDFNPAEDSIVRVNISNLRKKLESYYMKSGQNEVFYISIPIGGYRLLFTENTQVDNPLSHQEHDKKSGHPTHKTPNFISDNLAKKTIKKSKFGLLTWLILVLSLSLVANVFQAFESANDKNINGNAHNTNFYLSGIWSDLTSTKKPSLIVLGDFHHYVEIDKTLNRKRVIIDPAINDDNTLKRYLAQFPEQSFVTQNSPLKLVSKGSSIAVKNLLSIFHKNNNKNIISASELTAYQMRSHDIFYIGPLNSMGMLSQFFKGSNVELNEDKSALIYKNGKERYSAPDYLSKDYVDYGLFAKIDGPKGNKIYIMSGFSDPAIMQVSWYLTSPQYLNSPEFKSVIEQNNLTSYNNFELLFKVPSVDGIDMQYQFLFGGKVNSDMIWAPNE